MGAGDSPALEVGEFDVNRGTRLMILGFNRVQLVRWLFFKPLLRCELVTRLWKQCRHTLHGPWVSGMVQGGQMQSAQCCIEGRQESGRIGNYVSC